MNRKRAARLRDELLARKHNVRWSELVSILEAFGWSEKRIKGSHHTWARGGSIYVFPVHGTKIAPVYVERAVAMCQPFDGDEPDSEEESEPC